MNATRKKWPSQKPAEKIVVSNEVILKTADEVEEILLREDEKFFEFIGTLIVDAPVWDRLFNSKKIAKVITANIPKEKGRKGEKIKEAFLEQIKNKLSSRSRAYKEEKERAEMKDPYSEFREQMRTGKPEQTTMFAEEDEKDNKEPETPAIDPNSMFKPR